MRFSKKLLLLLLIISYICSVSVSALAAEMPGCEEFCDNETIFLPVLMYHGVTKNLNRVGREYVTPQTFIDDMEYLIDNGYTTVSSAEILAYVDCGIPLPDKPVYVTFDDGFYSFMHYLMPTIERLGLKVVMNIEGSFAERSTQEDQHNPNWSYLTWDEIGELSKGGLVEFGNHTYDMHYGRGKRCGCKKIPGESLENYRDALNKDISMLQEKLKECCGETPLVFAYPFGSISEESFDILSGMGFRILLTCYGLPNYLKTDPGATLILNRYNRHGSLSTSKFMSKALKG